MKAARGLGLILGYGSFLVFLWLIGLQIYRWFREGEWTHIGLTDGLRILLTHAGIDESASGTLAQLLHWIDNPVDWLGLHQVFEVIPSSLVLFAVSVLGNCLFVYCQDRLDVRNTPEASS